MRVFITGGTGFVGNHLTNILLDNGYQVRCLVRPGSEGKLERRPDIEVWPGDIFDAESRLAKGIKDCQAVIHLIGIIREFPRKGITFERLHYQATVQIVNATQVSGVKRYLHMSSLGTRPDARSRYHQTKYRAEEYVRQSNLAFTIFQPSVIFGPADSFVNLFSQIIRRSSLVPVIGDGRYQMQPVDVYTVSQAFMFCLKEQKTVGRTFPLPGRDRFSFNHLLEVIAQVMDKKIVKIHIPIWLIYPMAYLLEGWSSFPLTTDQLIMLLEGNFSSDTSFYDQSGITPAPFAVGIRKYIKKNWREV